MVDQKFIRYNLAVGERTIKQFYRNIYDV